MLRAVVNTATEPTTYAPPRATHKAVTKDFVLSATVQAQNDTSGEARRNNRIGPDVTSFPAYSLRKAG